MSRHYTNPYLDQLLGLVRAVWIHSPVAFSWFGKRSASLPPGIAAQLTSSSSRAYLQHHLQMRLYRSFYCTGRAVRSMDEYAAQRSGSAVFIEALSAANVGHGYWEGGWHAGELTGEGRIAASRSGLRVSARLTDTLALPGAPGQEQAVSLRYPKESAKLSPGFYMAMGDHPLPVGTTGPTAPILRFYWNVPPTDALVLTGALTSSLNREGVAFRLKVLDDPDAFGSRCDTVVLYGLQSQYTALVEQVAGAYQQVADCVLGRVPALTKQLARGLGLAEDPGQSESFGQHRCRLLAEALITAYERNGSTSEERLDSIIARLDQEGIDPEKPFLNAGSRDTYFFQRTSSARSKRPPGQSMRPPEDRETDAPCAAEDVHMCLRAASSIGEYLAAEALWSHDVCNWIGAGALSSADGSRYATVYNALGPDLYSGSAGLALFLAELYATTGNDDVRRAAAGGMRLALRQANTASSPGPGTVALYTGSLGVCLAAIRVGALTGQDDLVDEAIGLSERLSSEAPEERQHDLLSGAAGGIVACLALEAVLGDKRLLELSTRLALQLQKGARKRAGRAGLSWPSRGFRTYGDLTGFSHGAAGIGYALLELWKRLGESEWRRLAEAAFDYEAARYEPEVQNWPDLREPALLQLEGRRVRSSATAWCHGAPGIALSRLRAFELTGEPERYEEARIALHTTNRAVATELDAAAPVYALCHGITGNTEVLLQGNLTRGGIPRGQLTVAEAAVRSVAGRALRPQQTGVAEHRALGLMLGLAGTGHFLLRRVNPGLPSVLLIQPEQWTQPS